MNKNITAVVRSAGERTEGLCEYLLRKQLPEENIFIVRKIPSTEGTRAVYDIGLREDRKWTLFVDADQLLLPEAVSFLYKLAESQPATVFGVKGTVRDKLFGDLRGKGCGPILYRTEAFNEAVKYIPDSYQVLRPDSFIINTMKAKGYGWARENIVVALHDHEQFYRDIYKKMFINARKMKIKCRKMLHLWEAMASEDNDFKVCMEGVSAGENYTGALSVDYSRSYGYSNSLIEKPEIRNYSLAAEMLCLT
jgi:hypothetical protein